MKQHTLLATVALAAILAPRATSIAFEPDRAKNEDGADGYLVHFGH